MLGPALADSALKAAATASTSPAHSLQQRERRQKEGESGVEGERDGVTGLDRVKGLLTFGHLVHCCLDP